MALRVRTSLGAFRTFPVQSLYVKAGETSLSQRRLRLAMNYGLKLHSVPENPAFDSVVDPKYLSHLAQPHITPALGIRLQPHFQAAGIDVEDISNDSLHTDNMSPWSIPIPVVRFDLT